MDLIIHKQKIGAKPISKEEIPNEQAIEKFKKRTVAVTLIHSNALSGFAVVAGFSLPGYEPLGKYVTVVSTIFYYQIILVG